MSMRITRLAGLLIFTLIYAGCSIAGDLDDYKQKSGKSVITYTVHYDKNAEDAYGNTDDNEHIYDTEQVLTTNGYSLTGWIFAGWNTQKDGQGVNYSDSQSGVMNLSKTAGAEVTLYAIWSPIISATVNFWVNEDDQLHISTNGIVISNSGGHSFTAMVTGGFTDIQWFIQGNIVSDTETITINAVNYIPGNYRLGVMVFKDTAPYSTEIRFTVTD